MTEKTGLHYYCYIFADGYEVFAEGFSPTELYFEMCRHGRIVSKRSCF